MEGFNEEGSNQLTLEQQFELSQFAMEIENISLDKAKELLVDMRRALMLQRSMTEKMLKDCMRLGLEGKLNQ